MNQMENPSKAVIRETQVRYLIVFFCSLAAAFAVATLLKYGFKLKSSSLLMGVICVLPISFGVALKVQLNYFRRLEELNAAAEAKQQEKTSVPGEG